MAQLVQPPTRDIAVALSFGNIGISINAEGVSWSPDVASDMAARIMGLLRDTLAEAASYGLLPSDTSEFAMAIDDEDEDGE